MPEEPTDDIRRLAAAVDPPVDVDREFPLFRAHYAAEGRRSVDWSARWEKWLRNPIGNAVREAEPTGSGFRDPTPGKFVQTAMTAYELALRGAGENQPKPAKELELRRQAMAIAIGGEGTFGLEGKIQWTAEETIRRVRNMRQAA